MSRVRLLVGTRKGAFVMTADGNRKDWKIDGPFFGGLEIYHVQGSPINPDRLYASQVSDWFGQVVHRSNDGGKTWDAVGNNFTYVGDPGTHQWYDGSQKPWVFKRIWSLTPSLTDAETVYAGAEDAALFSSTRWRSELAGTGGFAQCEGTLVAARWRWNVPAYDLAGPVQPEANVYRHFGRRCLPHR